MKFWIVTPTFNSLPWLPQCIRSIADQAQEGIEIHHHVQDGGSTDGTAAWLQEYSDECTRQQPPNYRFSYASKRDRGMYDAINIGWALAPSDIDIIAHLNSDEQYLPGALSKVAEAAAQHPRADILLGTYIILDKNSRYIAHRRPVPPRVWSSYYTCAVITNSCFHRASAFRRHGIRFDIRWKSISDMVFYSALARAGLRFQTIPVVTSAFYCTGDNLAWSEASWKEGTEYARHIPWWASKLNPFIYRWVNLKRRLADIGQPAPREYAVYLPHTDVRTTWPIHHPTVCWGFRTTSSEPAGETLADS